MRTSNVLNVRIGAKIKKIREENKIKQEWLAMKVGLGKSEISRVENGKRGLSIKRLNKIAVVLNVELSYFFDQE